MDRPSVRSAQRLVTHVLANPTPPPADAGSRHDLVNVLRLGPAPFGPFTPEVMAVLERLIRVDEGAQDRIRRAWRVPHTEPPEEIWARLYRPAEATEQPPAAGGAFIAHIVWRLPTSGLTPATCFALAPCLRAMACAHLLHREH